MRVFISTIGEAHPILHFKLKPHEIANLLCNSQELGVLHTTLLTNVQNNYCFTKITCSCIMTIVIVIVVFVNFSSHAYIFNFHVKTSA